MEAGSRGTTGEREERFAEIPSSCYQSSARVQAKAFSSERKEGRRREKETVVHFILLSTPACVACHALPSIPSPFGSLCTLHPRAFVAGSIAHAMLASEGKRFANVRQPVSQAKLSQVSRTNGKKQAVAWRHAHTVRERERVICTRTRAHIPVA